MTGRPRYRRILVKISGEALAGEGEHGVDPREAKRIADDIAMATAAGARIAVVVGGGNIFRGLAGAARGMERVSADHMGMLATVINALALEHALAGKGIDTRVLSAIPMPTICEPYARTRAVAHLDKGRVVLFAAGTGSPYFTTDTAAALRAVETGCDALFKATQVDGVYSADPSTDRNATRYDRLSYHDVLVQNLQVMDAAAICLARDNSLPCLVFSLHEPGGLTAVLTGTGRYTIISTQEDEGHG